MPKELLCPKGEQTRDLRQGDIHPIALYIDSSERLAGTMKVREYLWSEGEFEEGEWAQGEAWRSEEGVGVFVILEKNFLGLVPEAEPTNIARGESRAFRVAKLLPDGKLVLSLRALAHEAMDGDAEKILSYLQENPGSTLGDKSSPASIEAAVGISKKAFKRAAGKLFRQGAVKIEDDGTLRIKK
jgi:uncharacterized protein